uniref:Uncharacterized protein n=1 Tax=Coturnix japonica TaxID=93934 RepID=A0A8C2T1A1_COTJA
MSRLSGLRPRSVGLSRRCLSAMEEDGEMLLLNIGSAPSRPSALKRKLQSSPHGNPPLKRKPKPSVNNFKKRVAETGTREKGSSSKRSLPKKQLTANQNESQKSKLFIKTSSLFRNNPDIPEIHRKAVQQVQENVFTTDSFGQLDLHPHLIATITTVLKICNMTR